MINILPYFNYKESLTIGRHNNNDVILIDSTVSKQHCSIKINTDNSFKLTDFSKNGTFIDGKLCKNESLYLKGNEKIMVGNTIIYIHNPIKNEVAIEVNNLEKIYNHKTALHTCSFNIKKGEFVAIMGPTGCGKSTLIKCLSGTTKINTGEINILGLSLNKNFNALKNLLGYVPQDDIVNKELTLNSSILYAAKLRLGSKISSFKLKEVIDNSLNAVNLNDVEIRKTKISKLSGGQRKRLCIAIELLTKPEIIFLDEPTSPLDPETIEDFLQCLKNLTTKGTTIVMVTHKPEDLIFTDNVIWLSNGGYMVYANNSKSFLSYFNVHRTTEVYALLKNKEIGKEFYNKRLPPENKVKDNSKINLKQDNSPFFHQFKILLSRNIEIKLADKKNLLIQIGQAPIIGILLTAIFFKGLTIAFLFMLTISAIWFGIANSAKEIVDENSIYKRERQFNLKIGSYLVSKLMTLCMIGVIQIVLLLGTCYIGLNILNHTNFTSLLPVFINLTIVYFSALLMGLLLSAIVNTTEKAMTIQPLMLMPQILLAGVIYPLKAGNTLIAFFSLFTLSRWGTLGSSHHQNVVEFQTSQITNAEIALSMPDNFMLWENIGSNLFNQQLYFCLLILMVLSIILFVMLYLTMLMKDRLK